MNHMPPPVIDVSAMNAIVALVLLFAFAITVAWCVSPRLRRWVEKPGYRFQQDARTYDESLIGRKRL